MHGLSTLNRLLGKKNKEASRSTTNLSLSSSNLDTSSQHNKISPIVNNAPFEQTFRVTVYLPKKQLYVERIGAKTKLSALLERICDNKDLTAEKFEFRHPGDMSQVFSNDKTIGEVGLNELKLVLKTESHFNDDFHRFHSDDMMKYKSSVPDSVSSSEISRNYSKNVLQKPSPYSSTTSLNSLDSTGMNLTAKQQPPVAPARKKRAAPRPPSQNSIPEQEIFGTTLNVFKEPHSILPRKNFHVSSPQLFNNNTVKQEAKSDKNNNIETGNRLNAITRPSSLYVTSTTEADQIESVGRQRSPSESSEVQQILQDRRNSNSLEKKKKPAPVPPKRVHKPVPSPRTVQEDLKPATITEIREIDEEAPMRLDNKVVDQAVSSSNISKTMLNNIPTPDEQPSVESSDGPISIQIVSSDSSMEHETTSSPKLPAVSKVHIKPDEERRSSSEDEMTVNIYNVTKSIVTLEKQNQMTVSTSIEERKIVHDEPKEQKTVIVPIRVEQNGKTFDEQKTGVLPEQVEPQPKQNGQTFVVPIEVEKRPSPVISPVEERKTITNVRSPPREIKSEKKSPVVEQRSPSPLWTYTLPAPPVFADSTGVNQTSPTDNQKQGDKFFSDFTSTCNETILSDSNTTVISAETQIHPIIVDRKQSVETFIMTPKEFTKVADDASDKSTEIITSDLEDGYLGNGVVGKVDTPEPIQMEKEIVVEDFRRSRLLIARSDSFHSIGQGRNFDIGSNRTPLKPAQRSTSFLSLVQAHKAENPTSKLNTDNAPYNRQKSASELSINDVPSLQSIEVLKNILNSSRKNSLQDASPKEEKVISFIREEPVERIVPMKVEEPEKKPERVIPVTVAEPVKSIERVFPMKIEEPILRKPERQEPDTAAETKPAQTKWRYTGPPKINFTTWSERPKVDVAIAADSDYKFGVGTATLPRDFKNKFEGSSKRHTIHISNDRKDEVEINTKPKVLGVEYKKDVVSPIYAKEPFPVLRETSNEIARKPVNQIESEPTSQIVTKPTRTIINIKPRPMSMDLTNAYSSITTSTAPVSYNRLNSNAKKFTPVVHGFKLNNINEGDQVDASSLPVVRKNVEVKSFAPPSVPAKPAFLRSTSAGDINRKMKFTVAEEKVDDDPSSFSQFGLRKTGLKEKILLNDKETKSIFGKVVEPKQEFVLRNHNYEAKPENHATVRSLSHPVSPKPPTLPPPASFRKSAPVDSDTRNQLLDAIKGFNKDSLRRK